MRSRSLWRSELFTQIFCGPLEADFLDAYRNGKVGFLKMSARTIGSWKLAGLDYFVSLHGRARSWQIMDVSGFVSRSHLTSANPHFDP